jgi:hypothetical protein
VDRVAQDLREHPDLAGSRVERSLRFKKNEREPEKRTQDASAFRWIADFFSWMSNSARWLLWTLCAVIAAVLLVRLRAWWLARDGLDDSATRLAPTRVRDLDIRPESLPVDVGAAALALWRAGRMHEALSLLYRGALSRLVHGHGVAIQASSTEGDCLRLAGKVLSMSAMSYLEVLVTAWQQAVYADQPPRDEQMALLCATFDARLTARATASPSMAMQAA